MRPALRRLFLLALATDADGRCRDGVWTTRCLHCRTRLQVRADGSALGASSLEHVVPQSWFGKRVATSLPCEVRDDPDAARDATRTRARAGRARAGGRTRFRGGRHAAGRRLERWRES